MRVLILSWEYPPIVVGGLGRHVHALATTLAAQGHDVTVVTRHDGDAPLDEVLEDVRVVRTPEDPPRFSFFDDLLAWTMAFNHALTRAAADVVLEQPPDVVHAHDWLVAHAAVTTRQLAAAPLVATVHATEAGRHRGWLPNRTSRSIHDVEWWLAYEARRVVVCSEHMRHEVGQLFDLPPGRCDVIPNGVTPHTPRTETAAVARRDRRGPRVVFVGRLVYEKGAQDLLAAVPRLRRRHPGLQVEIVGAGPMEGDLRALARRLRLGRSVAFRGHLPDSDCDAAMAAADCVVVPSHYEPFGMVALEAAAAGTPLVAAHVGGLREFVDPGRTGVTFPAEDVPALADAVSSVLTDELLARRLVRGAGERLVHGYAWESIARRTAEVYARAVEEERILPTALHARTRPPRVPERGSGNLFTGEPG